MNSELDFNTFIGLPIKELLFLENRIYKYDNSKRGFERKLTPSYVFNYVLVLSIGEHIFDIHSNGVFQYGKSDREGIIFDDVTYLSECPYMVEELIKVGFDLYDATLSNIGYLRERENTSKTYNGVFIEINGWKKIYFVFQKLTKITEAHASDYTIEFSEIYLNQYRLIETNNQMLFHSTN